MVVDAQSVIEALIRALEVPAHRTGSPHQPVVTLSRMSGSRGDEIARALAARLGVGCYNREILDAVASRSGTSGRLLETLTEKVDSVDAWLYATLFGARFSRNEYLRHLSAVIRGLYHTGGVIVGRGGHLILAGRNVLRVRIVGSVDACASRLSEAEGLSFADARRLVRERNDARDRFTLEMFGSHLGDETSFDLIINTDRFGDDDGVVDLIATALNDLNSAAPAETRIEVPPSGNTPTARE